MNSQQAPFGPTILEDPRIAEILQHLYAYDDMSDQKYADTYYVGYRRPNAAAKVTVVDQYGYITPLKHIVRHSPTGLEWGYGGSGPTDLALSILADCLAGDVKTVNTLAYAYTSGVIASMWGNSWYIAKSAVRTWVASEKALQMMRHK